MQQMQQVADAGGKIAPLAKALPEEAKALVNAEQYGSKTTRKILTTTTNRL